jgi:hypothetical protein
MFSNQSIIFHTQETKGMVKGKEKKGGIWIGKEEVKQSLFADEMIIYLRKSYGFCVNLTWL